MKNFELNRYMDHTTSRSLVLGLIKSALESKSGFVAENNPDPTIFFSREHGSDVEIFERALRRLQGNFLRCRNETFLADSVSQLPSALLECNWYCSFPEILSHLQDAGIRLVEDGMQAEVVVTGCECLVARTGSVVLSAAQHSGRALPVYAPVHITIAKQSQLVYDTDNAISFLLEKYGEQLPSSLHFVAGPSRTGDIEKTLVMGVHGPKDVFVLLLEE